jgi:hypothetical protein
MITAYLINKIGDIVSDEYMINDDDEFRDLIQIAKNCNETVAIKWQRSTDGQVAYWSPNGASLAPHWFNGYLGNKNAAKDDADKLSSSITARCNPNDKARWVKAAQADGAKLTDWIIRALNEKARNAHPTG